MRRKEEKRKKERKRQWKKTGDQTSYRKAHLSSRLPPALSSFGGHVYLSLLLGVSVNSFLFLWHRAMHRRARCSDFAMLGMQRHYACAPRTLLGTDEQPDPLCPSTTTSGRSSVRTIRRTSVFLPIEPPPSRRLLAVASTINCTRNGGYFFLVRCMARKEHLPSESRDPATVPNSAKATLPLGMRANYFTANSF